jgi:hypothetical protein
MTMEGSEFRPLGSLRTQGRSGLGGKRLGWLSADGIDSLLKVGELFAGSLKDLPGSATRGSRMGLGKASEFLHDCLVNLCRSVRDFSRKGETPVNPTPGKAPGSS